MRLALQRDRNGGWSCRYDGYLFVLSRRATDLAPSDGSEAEYMITDVLGSHPKGFVVEPVTAEYRLVAHSGFECSGTMCATTAWTNDEAVGCLTPGRVMDLLPVAQNVNARVDGRDRQPRRPGRIYVRNGERRGAGLPDLSEVDLAAALRLAEHRKRMRDNAAEVAA